MLSRFGALKPSSCATTVLLLHYCTTTVLVQHYFTRPPALSMVGESVGWDIDADADVDVDAGVDVVIVVVVQLFLKQAP